MKSREEKYQEAVRRNLDAAARVMSSRYSHSERPWTKERSGIREDDNRFDEDIARLDLLRTQYS